MAAEQQGWGTWKQRVHYCPLGTNEMVFQRKHVAWNLRGKDIGFVITVVLRVRFQPQDNVIIVTNFQHRQTLYQICYICTFEQRQIFNVIFTIRRKNK